MMTVTPKDVTFTFKSEDREKTLTIKPDYQRQSVNINGVEFSIHVFDHFTGADDSFDTAPVVQIMRRDDMVVIKQYAVTGKQVEDVEQAKQLLTRVHNDNLSGLLYSGPTREAVADFINSPDLYSKGDGENIMRKAEANRNVQGYAEPKRNIQ